MTPCFLIFGFGYTAQVLAPKLIAKGFKVLGTTSNAQTLQKDHPEVQLIDFTSPNMKTYLSLSTHILISIPPKNSEKDPVLLEYAELIKQQAPHLQWLGYLSSTGVFGDKQGAWVDEQSECTPHTTHGIARLKAEQSWHNFAQNHQLPLHIFRLSGIYGPKRNAIERLKQGKKQSIYKENQVFCRIHVEDIVSTLLASIAAPKPMALYNVSDEEPAPAHTVDLYAALLLGLEPPPLISFSEADLSPMEKEFYTNNRRVANLRIKNELGINLKYPTYKEGLTQIWKELTGD